VLIVTSKLLKEGKDLNADDTDQILIGTAMAGGYGTKIADDLGGARVGDKIWLTYSMVCGGNIQSKGFMMIQCG